MERAQKAELHQAMALCVQAVGTGPAAFEGWRVAKGRIPEGYLTFERFGTPDGAVRALLGTREEDQRRDCWMVFPGGPLAGVSAEAASDQIANLQTITLAGQRFVGDELGDAPALAGCLGAQQYLIWAQDQGGTTMLAVAPAQDSGGAC